MKKYEINNEADYQDFLYGKILSLADEKGCFEEALRWFYLIRSTKEMEDYLEKLQKIEERDK
jgi:hypothetical protein